MHGKKIYLYRLLFNLSNSTELIDHINHNIRDNRRTNLRIVSSSQNQMNRDKTKQNTSGIKGVYWNKNKKKWQASIQVDKKLIHLGVFNTKQEAAEARQIAENQYFGQYNYYQNIGVCSNG